MAAGTAVVVLVVLLLAVGIPLVLWRLIEAETEGVEAMDRESAERAARRAAAEEPRNSRTDDR